MTCVIGATSQRRRWATSASANAISEADRDRRRASRSTCCDERVRCSGRSCRRSSPGRGRCSATHVSLVRSRISTWASRSHGASAPSDRSGSARVRGPGISIESTPATRRARRRPARTARPREQVGERVAQDVVSSTIGSARAQLVGVRSPASVALRQPAERASSSSTSERVGHVRRRRRRAAAVGSPTRTSGAFQRSMSRTRWSARRLSARSAPTKSSTKSSAGRISSSAGVRVLGETPPAAASRCGRPS